VLSILRGVPAKFFYRVDLDELDRLLFENKDAGNVQASFQESSKPVCRIPENKNSGIIKPFLLAETTTEITSETTAESVSTGRLCSLPLFLRRAMIFVLWILLELNRISARPVLAEIDGRPTRIELERPDERPTRYIRPRR